MIKIIIIIVIILNLYINKINSQNLEIYIKYNNSNIESGISNCNITYPCSSFSTAGNLIRKLTNSNYDNLEINLIIDKNNNDLIVKDQDYIGELDFYKSIKFQVYYIKNGEEFIPEPHSLNVTIDGSKSKDSFLIINQINRNLDGNQVLYSRITINGFKFINFNNNSGIYNNGNSAVIMFKNFRGDIEFDNCIFLNSLLFNNEKVARLLSINSCLINNIFNSASLYFDNYIITDSTFQNNNYPIIFNGGQTLIISSSTFYNFNSLSSIIIVNNNYEVTLQDLNFINNNISTTVLDYSDNRNEKNNKLTLSNINFINNSFNSPESYLIKSSQPNNIIIISINNLTLNKNNNNNQLKGLLNLENYFIINQIDLSYINFEINNFINILKTSFSKIIIYHSIIPSSDITIDGTNNNIQLSNTTYNSIIIESPYCNTLNNKSINCTSKSLSSSPSNLILAIVFPVSLFIIICVVLVIIIIYRKKMKLKIKLQHQQDHQEIDMQPQQQQQQLRNPSIVNQIIDSVYNEDNGDFTASVGRVELVIPNFLNDSDSNAGVDDNIN